MKKLFNFKKQKTDSEDQPQDAETDKRTMYFYAAVFLIILVFSVVSNFFSDRSDEKDESENQPNQQTETFTTPINLIESNNFDMELIIRADSDLINFLIRRQSANKELISKTHGSFSKIYYKDADKLYEADGKLKQIDNIDLYNGYDTTFINTDNLINLVKNKTHEISLKEENYDIKRYKIEISKVINIYNEYNKSDLKKTVSGEVIMDVNYKGEELLGITLDLSALYHNFSSSYSKVIYYFEFEHFNEVDMSSILTQ